MLHQRCTRGSHFRSIPFRSVAKRRSLGYASRRLRNAKNNNTLKNKFLNANKKYKF